MPTWSTAGRVVLHLAAAFTAALPAGAADPAAPSPALSFAGSQVVVSGVEAGGQVVLFGVAQEVDDYVPTFRRRDALLADEDRDGTVALDVGAEVPWRSLWVAVELATGRAAVASPPGYPLREIAPAEGRVQWSTAGESAAVEVGGSWVEGLFVQPGLGAWHFTAGDAADGEEDGVSRVALDETDAAGPALPAAPSALREGDLLFVIDPSIMAILCGTAPKEQAVP